MGNNGNSEHGNGVTKGGGVDGRWSGTDDQTRDYLLRESFTDELEEILIDSTVNRMIMQLPEQVRKEEVRIAVKETLIGLPAEQVMDVVKEMSYKN